MTCIMPIVYFWKSLKSRSIIWDTVSSTNPTPRRPSHGLLFICSFYPKNHKTRYEITENHILKNRTYEKSHFTRCWFSYTWIRILSHKGSVSNKICIFAPDLDASCLNDAKSIRKRSLLEFAQFQPDWKPRYWCLCLFGMLTPVVRRHIL